MSLPYHLDAQPFRQIRFDFRNSELIHVAG